MKLSYRSDIDGLRAFAVLSVFIYHLNNNWLGGGFIGVDIFFVISGFLITKIIYTDIINNQFSFKAFYQRRINRILPVFFFVMFVSFIVALFVLLPNDFRDFLYSLRNTFYIAQNIHFAKRTNGYFDNDVENMPLLHTWTLAVEEQFYILLPLFLIVLYKLHAREKTILFILVLIAFISFLLSQLSPYSAFLSKYNYYHLITRAGELLVGSIAGILSINKYSFSSKTSNILTFVGFVGIVLSVMLISQKYLYPSFLALIPTLSAALIIFFGSKESYVSKLLSFKPFVYIGKISYSMYLWHWVVIVFTKKYLFISEFSLALYMFVIVLTFALSLFSYKLIETPARQGERSFMASLVMFYLIPAAIFFSIYGINSKTRIFETKAILNFDKEKLTSYNLQRKYLNPNSNFCHGENIKDSCTFGDTLKQPKILMIGDSHGGHYSPYLDEAGKYYNFSAKILTLGGCFFINYDNKQSKDCIKRNEYIKSIISEYDTIVLAYSWNARIKNVDKEIIQAINKLAENHKVIIFGQVPMLKRAEYDKYLDYFLKDKEYGGELIDENKSNKIDELNRQLKALENDNITYFYPLDSVGSVYNGLIIYKDVDHLNEHSTRQWAKEILPKQREFWEKFSQE
ncbi:MAG: acyltransferase [Campylobacteraceae bacterium]|nr:acyltransferase [Campylobacteraceae bacterium]